MHRNLIRYWKASLGIGVTSVALVLVATSNLAGTQSVALASVSAKTLGVSGWQLTQPGTMETATISREAAVQAVSSAFPGAQVREVAIAHVHNDHIVPTLDRLLWVVSILPPGGIQSKPPSGFSPTKGTYFLVFVDPATGQILMTTSGGEVA
jgi:hypothetical protein